MGCKVEWFEDYIKTSYFGIVEKSDIVSSINTYVGDHRFEDIHFQIVDYDKVEKFDFPDSEVLVFSALDKSAGRWNDTFKIAHITSRKDLIDKINIYIKEMEPSTWENKIFDSYEEAFEWCTMKKSTV